MRPQTKTAKDSGITFGQKIISAIGALVLTLVTLFVLLAIAALLVCFAEISGRDPFEVKGWNQGIDTGNPAHILGQNRTGKAPQFPMAVSHETGKNLGAC